MIIRIIVPNSMKHKYIKMKTERYFINLSNSQVIDKQLRYSLTINNRSIKICIFSLSQSVKDEINDYIDYTFKSSYIGIIGDQKIINPHNVKTYQL